MKPTLLVLAAGMGSRYGGLKQMDPMGPGGETIIDYSIWDAARAGFGKVVFVIRPDFADDFKSTLGSRFEKVLEVGYAYQELAAVPSGFQLPSSRQKPWGTGHAILVARDAIMENFAVINADDYYGVEGFKTMVEYLGTIDKASSDTSMIGYTLRQTLSEHGTVARGICEVNDKDELVKVVETLNIEKRGRGAAFMLDGKETVLSGDEAVSMNFWGFTPKIFEHLESQFKDFLAKHGSEEKSEFFIPYVVDNMIQAGETKTTVLRSGAKWFGVTYPDDKPKVVEAIAKLVQDGVYPKNLWEGKS